MKKIVAIYVLMLACLSASADEYKGKPGKMIQVQSNPKTWAPNIIWLASDQESRMIVSETGKFIVFQADIPGRYRLRSVVGAYDDKTKAVELNVDEYWILLEGPVPPGPGPQPPSPVDPAPIPGIGFRVLMVFAKNELPKYPQSQVLVFSSGEVRSYLNARCVAGPDGKTKDWRTWDITDDVSNEAKIWQDAMKLVTKTPWIIVSNGVSGFSGPLPATISETMILLKKYGGE